MEHIVELMEDHSPIRFVMARDCHVYRDKKDTIKWKNDTDTDYTIRFEGDGPVLENNFTVSAHGEKGPFQLRQNISKGTYAYLIEPESAKLGKVMAADPNVIVH